jgi:hypothetical protein
MPKITPLHGSFMLFSIIGFLSTVFIVKDLSWKVSFMIVFIAMFIASIISMTYGPVSEKIIK